MSADKIHLKTREENVAFNVKFITETLSLCFKESPRANLGPSSPFAQSHHRQGHIERAIIELVMLDLEFLLFFWRKEERSKQTHRKKRAGRKKVKISFAVDFGLVAEKCQGSNLLVFEI